MEGKNLSNIESAIQRFQMGSATPNDEKIIYNWMKENPEDRDRVFREKDIWESTKLGSEQLNELEDKQWVKFQSRILSRQSRTFSIAELIKIAAIVVISLGIGWFGRSLYTQRAFPWENAEMQSIKATKGQVKEIFLADGTHVWLNSDSELSFPDRFNSNNRNVKLNGEAYFEVTANEKKPFFVRTGNHTVKVIGTRFNVCKYSDTNIIETTLEEGKVKIITGDIIHDLLPGEQSSFSTSTCNVRISKTDIDIYTTWKDGRYEFRNEPINKIFQIIERWWDVKIDYPENLKEERISGVLRRYKPLEQHFELIKQLLPIKYEINSDEIKITVQ